jgi:hypothetical protein
MKRKTPLKELPRDRKPPLAQLRDYPQMTSWFSPTLLVKLLWRVVISDVFGQYADRRLIEAALDPASKAEIQARDDLSKVLQPDNSGAVWVDFVADLGDGFDSTYAIAYLLAQPSLSIDGDTLPRGGALFMGGDEVYPTSGRVDYNIKTRAPYQFAFPSQKRAADHPRLFAIPGNHDWYDGLVNFLAFFTRAKPTPFGNWRTQQKRSYFAAKLNDLCWLWAIDIALVADMDQPQADYFAAVAAGMPQNANVILCSAEPGWYKTESDSYRTLSYAAWIAENAGKSLKIPLVLSGDTHHYARYSSTHGTHYVTSGGGGAFLHGTHDMPREITADWLRYPHEKLSLQSCHPDVTESRKLLKGDFAFPFLNYGFSATLGTLYAALGYILSLAPRADLALIFFTLVAAMLLGYSAYQEKLGGKVAVLSILHSAVHFVAMLGLTWLMIRIDHRLWSLHTAGPWWLWLLELAVPMIFVGGLVAGFIFGAYLYLTCRFANMNHNDAFSAMRLNAYRHFLRIRIVGDQITVYPVGADRIPERHEWRDNPQSTGDEIGPYFLPPATFAARLLEPPIVISGWQVSPTTDVKHPSELTPRS